MGGRCHAKRSSLGRGARGGERNFSIIFKRQYQNGGKRKKEEGNGKKDDH